MIKHLGYICGSEHNMNRFRERGKKISMSEDGCWSIIETLLNVEVGRFNYEMKWARWWRCNFTGIGTWILSYISFPFYKYVRLVRWFSKHFIFCWKLERNCPPIIRQSAAKCQQINTYNKYIIYNTYNKYLGWALKAAKKECGFIQHNICMFSHFWTAHLSQRRTLGNV